jgi:hypothetical protein
MMVVPQSVWLTLLIIGLCGGSMSCIGSFVEQNTKVREGEQPPEMKVTGWLIDKGVWLALLSVVPALILFILLQFFG